MICIGILISWCFVAEPKVVDSFCQVYNKVVVAKGDGTIVASAGVKRRLLANELTYRSQCTTQGSKR